MTFYLTHQEDDAGPESYHTQRVEFTVTDDADISELCDSFEHFLKATGYEFDGHIVSFQKKNGSIVGNQKMMLPLDITE